MKKIFSIIFISAFVYSTAQAQDARDILIRSRQAVSEIKSVHYMIYGKYRVTGMRDTLFHTGKCSFTQVADDTVMGRYILTENFNGTSEGYNGSIYFKSRRADSTAYLWDAGSYDFYKHQFATNPMAYSPLVNKKNLFTQVIDDSDTRLTLIDDTLIFNDSCFHILSVTQKLRNNVQTGITITAHLFIRKTDFIPAGHIQLLQSNISGSVNNYESFLLDDVSVNRNIDNVIYSLKSIPSNYTLKQQSLVNIKNYLVDKEQIPDFDIQWLHAENTAQWIKGKPLLLVVLKNATYYPCSQILENLDKLYSEKEDKLPQLLIVTTDNTNLREYKNLSSQLKSSPEIEDPASLITKADITTFPTMFLFDKDGKLADKFEGFGSYVKEDLYQALKQINSK